MTTQDAMILGRIRRLQAESSVMRLLDFIEDCAKEKHSGKIEFNADQNGHLVNGEVRSRFKVT